MVAKSGLKVGMLFVMFDLPTLTSNDRKRATKFRNNLLDDGYQMLQFSVYVRNCVSWERMKKHTKRLQEFAPIGGNIRAIMITEKQWKNQLP